MTKELSIDIESFGTPEKSGYNIVIPNYAVVPIPELPTIPIKSFFYVKMPFQEQIEKGLKVDNGSMDFWFNECRKNYPNSLNEITSTFNLKEPEVHHVYEFERFSTNDVIGLWKELRYNRYGEEESLNIWGNGCHFDCSILQANHLLQFDKGELWNYSSPQNARSIKKLLNSTEREEMDEIVRKQLLKFSDFAAGNGFTGLELHHPLYDAAREAIQISYCLNKKMSK